MFICMLSPFVLFSFFPRPGKKGCLTLHHKFIVRCWYGGTKQQSTSIATGFTRVLSSFFSALFRERWWLWFWLLACCLPASKKPTNHHHYHYNHQYSKSNTLLLNYIQEQGSVAIVVIIGSVCRDYFDSLPLFCCLPLLCAAVAVS